MKLTNKKSYNEKLIKEKFKNEKFVVQLHVTKNYLKTLVLKSLRNFHINISKDAELKDILRNIELLYNKELYQHCVEELRKAETIASKFELFSGMIEVQNWKRKLEQTLHPNNFEAFANALQVQKRNLKALENINQYWNLAVDVSKDIFNQPLEKIENLNLLNHPDRAKSIEATVLFFNTKYLRCLKKNETEKAGNQLLTLINYLENDRERLLEEPGLYISSINNLLSYYVFNKKQVEALKLIEKAKDIYNTFTITSENRTLVKQIIRTYNIEIEIYRKLNPTELKNEFLNDTESFIKRYTHKMPKEYLLSFWFQLASIYFTKKEFSKSLQWINLILGSKHKNLRTDLSVQAYMLNLMVHLEQNNLMVLRYYVDSTKRYLKKIKGVQPFEEILLKFFVKIGRLPLLDYKSAFKELNDQLFPENQPSLIPDDVFGLINYKEWIEGKIG